VTALLAEAATATESSADLTRQLLAFSRKQIVVPKVTDLNDLLRQLSSLLARMLGEDIRLQLSLAADLGRARVDPGQIKQVVMNLAVNSRDAMPHGGLLELATQNRVLDAGDAMRLDVNPGEYVTLSVRDTGTGMSPEVSARLFEPFFTTKAPGKGTGLGLAIVYGAMKQSGGGIEVHSEPGAGAEFRLLFPKLDASPDHAEPSAEGPPRGTETILLVEDETVVRNIARSILERLGYRVIACASAREALAAIDVEAIDLLLTDVVMPEMGGRELALRVTERLPEVAVLYTSGYAEDVIVRMDVAEEAAAFLAKPYSIDVLAHKVRAVLDAQRRTTPRPLRRG
jgi:CheY-like chemotaxis protein